MDPQYAQLRSSSSSSSDNTSSTSSESQKGSPSSHGGNYRSPAAIKDAGRVRPFRGRSAMDVKKLTNPPISGSDPEELRATAAAAVQESDLGVQTDAERIKLPSRTRVDSAHESDEGHSLPLKVSTEAASASPNPQAVPTMVADKLMGLEDDTISNSPTLRKHVITVRDSAITLPAVQTNPVNSKDRASISSQTPLLPPISQLVPGRLTGLAELATQHDSRQSSEYSHHHRHSISSTTSQSSFPYVSSAQTSPAAPFVTRTRTPPNIPCDYQAFNSPQYAHFGSLSDRRSSCATDHSLLLPAPMPSGSSSGDSRGTSIFDGRSASQPTSIESPTSTNGSSRPVLPPPPGMIAQIYQCDWPGCTAQPFQTQYLLSSHKNVHSQNRPHYCPVKGCSRGEGGLGFKRKNEMIRHGLVHNSPGYVCPFCPDREHRYPRPDNLQRHVRVHHLDKDRDDPALREVLAQRTQGAGAGKQRRRRAQTSLGGFHRQFANSHAQLSSAIEAPSA